MTTELTEDQIKNGKISILLDIQLPYLDQYANRKTEKKKRVGKITREAKDNLTSLSADQTALLMYYLQKERVLLKDEYLNDAEAGQAFELLIGYSHHTLRQKIGQFHLFQNLLNLKALSTLLSRIKASIEKDLEQLPQ